jgi:hypothetical protein
VDGGLLYVSIVVDKLDSSELLRRGNYEPNKVMDLALRLKTLTDRHNLRPASLFSHCFALSHISERLRQERWKHIIGLRSQRLLHNLMLRHTNR